MSIKDAAMLPPVFLAFFFILQWMSRLPPAPLVAACIRGTVKKMARRFIAGETREQATVALKELHDTGRDATLDNLGELVVSEKEADQYLSGVLKLIRGFSMHVRTGERNAAGILRANV